MDPPEDPTTLESTPNYQALSPHHQLLRRGSGLDQDPVVVVANAHLTELVGWCRAQVAREHAIATLALAPLQQHLREPFRHARHGGLLGLGVTRGVGGNTLRLASP